MKLGIAQSNGNITLNGVNIKSSEIKYLKLYFESQGWEVDLLGSKNRNNQNKDISKTSLCDYDRIILYPQPANFFGGIVDSCTIDLYEGLKSFNNDLYLFYGDPKIKTLDIYNVIKERQIKDHLGRTISETSKLDNLFSAAKILTPSSECFKNKVQLDLFAYMYSCGYIKIQKRKPQKDFDFVYFGNNRGGSRNKKLNHLLKESKYKKLVIGFTPKWKNTKSIKYVRISELSLLVESAKYTLIVSDDDHKWVTPRFYECMSYNCFSFIYHDYPRLDEIIKTKELKDMMVVSSQKDLEEKMKIIDKRYYHWVDLQQEEMIKYHSAVIKENQTLF